MTLAQEAHEKFDPEVVDHLLEHLDRRFTPQRVPGQPDGHDCEALPVAASAGGLRLPLAQHQLDLLDRIARASNERFEVTETLDLAAGPLNELWPHKALVAYRRRDDDGSLHAFFARGTAESQLLGTTVHPDPAFADRLSGGEPLSADDPCVRAPFEVAYPGAPDPLRSLRPTWVIPLSVLGRPVGALVLYDVESRRLSEEGRRLLLAAATRLAPAVRRWSDPGATRRASLTDSLTGLPNGNYLWLELAGRLSPAAGDHPIGLLAFRVPALLELGRRWGIGPADRALVQIGRRLAQACVDGETLVRLGRDLFVVLGNWRRSTQVERWQSLVEAVEAAPLAELPDEELSIKLQVAHVRCPDDGTDLDALLAELEERLNTVSVPGRSLLPFRTARTA